LDLWGLLLSRGEKRRAECWGGEGRNGDGKVGNMRHWDVPREEKNGGKWAGKRMGGRRQGKRRGNCAYAARGERCP